MAKDDVSVASHMFKILFILALKMVEVIIISKNFIFDLKSNGGNSKAIEN